ncbi:recombinase family protein [Bacillus sp. JJ1562]|uniref:recombinase family protein n=1 Tax=Bacillus sp. JJ1562 TaxID=3122960 RepID=UPI003F68B9C3
MADSVTPRSAQPKGLQQLLELIKSDQVDTLIVFQRDRLTRSFDEYLKMLKLIYQHEIKIVFTAREYAPFNHDLNTGIISESLFLLNIEMERTIMSNRIKAALKKNNLKKTLI